MRNPAGPVGPLRDEPLASPPLAVCLSGILSFSPGTYHQPLSPLSISRRAPIWCAVRTYRGSSRHAIRNVCSNLGREPRRSKIYNPCSTTGYYNQLFEDKTLLMISTG